MRKADAIAATMVLRGTGHLLTACFVILAVQIVQSCIQWDHYVFSGACLVIGMIVLHGRLDQFSAMLLGLWLDLLYGRFLGLGVVVLGVVFHILEASAQERLAPRANAMRKMLVFLGSLLGIGLLSLC